MEASLNNMSEIKGLNEESLSSLKGLLNQVFHLEDKDLRTYSPLTLAYIGDGVYELVIRTILVKKGNCPVNQLHRKASSLVKAGTQSSMMEVIEPRVLICLWFMILYWKYFSIEQQQEQDNSC